jgi:hypothetical protein
LRGRSGLLRLRADASQHERPNRKTHQKTGPHRRISPFAVIIWPKIRCPWLDTGAGLRESALEHEAKASE